MVQKLNTTSSASIHRMNALSNLRWFCGSMLTSVLSAVVMIAVSAKAVKLSSTPCRAIRGLNECSPSANLTLTALNEFD